MSSHCCNGHVCKEPSHQTALPNVKGQVSSSLDTAAGESCCTAEQQDDDPGSEPDSPPSASCHKKSSCYSSGHSSEKAAADDILFKNSYSWKIQGMDCPSCAQKIEKAVKAISGIKQVKVLFATEKLVVEFAGPELLETVEQVAEKTGFTLTSKGRKSNSQQAEASLLKQNASLIILTLLMAAAFAVSRFSETYGQAAFTLAALWGLIPIVRKSINLAQNGTPFAIETLMSVAAVGALYLGETAEAAMVLLLFMLGERLEAYASGRARSGIKSLMALVPEEATLIVDGQRQSVSAEQLKPGDIIEVAPGGRLPADGILLTRATSFDESALTGESVPVERLHNEKVMAGSLSADRVVQIEITSEPGANAIDRILHLIEEAESRKAPLERFLDRFSRWYTPAMMVLAAAVIVVPPLFFAQPWDTWVYRGLTLLLIACPCALVISTPAAITSGLAAAAKRGALIKGGAALEQLGNIQQVAFDKTGTLTEGKPVLTDVVAWHVNKQQLLGRSAAVEVGSAHPLAKAVVTEAEQQGIKVVEADHREAIVGKGVQGEVDNVTVLLCAADRLPAHIQLTSSQTEQTIALQEQGKTLVVVLYDEVPVGMLAWRDNLREDAKAAVSALSKLGVSSLMLTGDNDRAAKAIAGELNMDYRAGLLPEDKVKEVELANTKGHVAMVGDGINDAPAMKSASVGIAMGGGTDVALETADAALTHNRIAELPMVIELSRATLNNIRQNIFLALGLKSVFLVTTLFGITGLWMAVLADSGATALVTLNALRLLKFKSKQE
ncbi:zinc/cadmium/mercury/lead-transporting ATPase [Psychromonas ossibalaenae]|uniref:zinc/cadmium/mercury/lead-transporting ATPase n=1 Tax=Psychromonas ossibalaenae TaxID=444922 RepID=UPI0003811563|nr:zinc/cadmium/mercury/lead-transporting ATPase [Psychromonas ossibalaenae]